MKTQIKLIFPAMLIAGMVSLASADIVLFDDAFQNSLSVYTAGGSSTTIVSSPNPVFSGTSSMQWSAGNFSMTGVKGFGSFDDFPVLQFYRYKTSGATGTIALRLGGGFSTFEIKNDGTHNEYISFDGVQGYNNAADQWFKVQIDIGGMIDDNVITTTPVNAIQVGNSSGTDIWYVDDMVQTIPEPSSMLLVGLGLLGVAITYRRGK
ncbi:MAG: PEP-CTERM sorting domain-containing protein [Kiritimatiellae bacterium]|jgi:hypothetical protein|nr:PEP-CTERM sorting domain-containing protein [Kiritimatiellia bacterium]